MAINPIIKQKAEDIRKKIFGAEVRESLASGLEGMSEDVESIKGRQGNVENQFQDVLDETTGKDVISAPELIAARNGKSNLKTRLDDEHAEVTAQLQQNEINLEKANTEVSSLSSKVGELGATSTFKGSDTYANILAKTGMVIGDEWFDTTNSVSLRWNGTAWTSVGGTVKIGEFSQDLRVLKERYLEKKNLLDRNSEDFLIGKGFSGTTGTLVNSASNFITNYIPVKTGEVLDCKIHGIDLFDATVMNYGGLKLATYDADKLWKTTKNTKDMTGFTATQDGFIRLQLTTNMVDVVIHTSMQQVYLSSDFILGLPEVSENNRSIVDLGIFMGQSNMAGRGIKRAGLELTNDKFPEVPSGWAYEFKPIYSPTMLFPLEEPFGYRENNADTTAINDSSNKTGSMVSAFAIDYYKITKTPLVCVSASQGSTGIDVWQPGTPKLNDAINRLNIAKNWLLTNDYEIGRVFMVWCQGEADYQMDVEEYKTKFDLMASEMVANGVEKCFNVRIGEHNSGDGTNYDSIIQAQTELCKVNKNIVLVGTKFSEMRLQGLMKDTSHYYQEGYNIQGSQAGINVANYIKLLKEPMIYDSKYSNLYYSNKL